MPDLNRCGQARNLFIAVPAYGAQISTETALSLIETVSALRKAGMPVMVDFLNGNCYVDAARNQLSADFLESDYDDMLFVDSDVGFLPETVLRMALATRPLIAAIYPKKEEKEEYPVQFKEGERWTDKEGVLEVLMAPTGLMRINRKVFEALTAPEYTTPLGRKLKAYFRCDVREYYFGEDVEFCRRWREVGGKVYILPEATLAHWGSKSWTANIGDAMKAGRV